MIFLIRLMFAYLPGKLRPCGEAHSCPWPGAFSDLRILSVSDRCYQLRASTVGFEAASFPECLGMGLAVTGPSAWFSQMRGLGGSLGRQAGGVFVRQDPWRRDIKLLVY